MSGLSSLASQLTKVGFKHNYYLETRNYETLIYAPEVARTVSVDAIYIDAIEGLAQLSQIYPAVEKYKESLFSSKMKTTTRYGVTSEEEKELNELLRLYLEDVSPFFMLLSVQKTIEYLIRHFLISEHLIDEIIIYYMLHFDQEAYIKFISVIPRARIMGSKWEWLIPYITDKKVLTKADLLKRFMETPSLFSEFVNQYKRAYSLSSKIKSKSLNSELISARNQFITSILASGIEVVSSVNIEVASLVTYYFTVCFDTYIRYKEKLDTKNKVVGAKYASNVEDSKAGSAIKELLSSGLILSCTVSTASRQNSEFWVPVFQKMSIIGDANNIKNIIRAMCIISQNQELESIPFSVISCFMNHTDAFIGFIKEYSIKYNASFLIQSIIYTASLSLNDRNVQYFLTKITGQLNLGLNQVLLFGVQIIDAVIHHATISDTNNISVVEDSSMRSIYSFAETQFRQLSQSYPDKFDKLLDSVFAKLRMEDRMDHNDKKLNVVFEILSASLVGTKYQLVAAHDNETDVPIQLHLALQHPHAALRKQALVGYTKLVASKLTNVNVDMDDVYESLDLSFFFSVISSSLVDPDYDIQSIAIKGLETSLPLINTNIVGTHLSLLFPALISFIEINNHAISSIKDKNESVVQTNIIIGVTILIKYFYHPNNPESIHNITKSISIILDMLFLDGPNIELVKSVLSLLSQHQLCSQKTENNSRNVYFLFSTKTMFSDLLVTINLYNNSEKIINMNSIDKYNSQLAQSIAMNMVESLTTIETLSAFVKNSFVSSKSVDENNTKSKSVLTSNGNSMPSSLQLLVLTYFVVLSKDTLTSVFVQNYLYNDLFVLFNRCITSHLIPNETTLIFKQLAPAITTSIGKNASKLLVRSAYNYNCGGKTLNTKSYETKEQVYEAKITATTYFAVMYRNALMHVLSNLSTVASPESAVICIFSRTVLAVNTDHTKSGSTCSSTVRSSLMTPVLKCILQSNKTHLLEFINATILSTSFMEKGNAKYESTIVNDRQREDSLTENENNFISSQLYVLAQSYFSHLLEKYKDSLSSNSVDEELSSVVFFIPCLIVGLQQASEDVRKSAYNCLAVFTSMKPILSKKIISANVSMDKSSTTLSPIGSINAEMKTMETMFYKKDHFKLGMEVLKSFKAKLLIELFADIKNYASSFIKDRNYISTYLQSKDIKKMNPFSALLINSMYLSRPSFAYSYYLLKPLSLIVPRMSHVKLINPYLAALKDNRILEFTNGVGEVSAQLCTQIESVYCFELLKIAASFYNNCDSIFSWAIDNSKFLDMYLYLLRNSGNHGMCQRAVLATANLNVFNSVSKPIQKIIFSILCEIYRSASHSDQFSCQKALAIINSLPLSADHFINELKASNLYYLLNNKISGDSGAISLKKKALTTNGVVHKEKETSDSMSNNINNNNNNIIVCLDANCGNCDDCLRSQGGIIRRAVRHASVVLELIMSHDGAVFFSHELVPILVVLLQLCVRARTTALEGVSLEFIKQLILRILEKICSETAGKTEQAYAFIESKLNIGAIIQCLRQTANPQTQNTAISLLTNISPIYPTRVLHSVMSIFTFMGTTLVKQDDDYSFALIERAIINIIPPVLKHLPSEGFRAPVNPHYTSNEAVCRLIHVFLAAFDHIPRHRRIPLFTILSHTLAKTLGEQETLANIIALYFSTQFINDAFSNPIRNASLDNNQQTSDVSDPRTIFAMTFLHVAASSVVTQFSTISHLMDLLSVLPLTYSRNPIPAEANILIKVMAFKSDHQLQTFRLNVIMFIKDYMESVAFKSAVSKQNSLYDTLASLHVSSADILKHALDNNDNEKLLETVVALLQMLNAKLPKKIFSNKRVKKLPATLFGLINSQDKAVGTMKTEYSAFLDNSLALIARLSALTSNSSVQQSCYARDTLSGCYLIIDNLFLLINQASFVQLIAKIMGHSDLIVRRKAIGLLNTKIIMAVSDYNNYKHDDSSMDDESLEKLNHFAGFLSLLDTVKLELELPMDKYLSEETYVHKKQSALLAIEVLVRHLAGYDIRPFTTIMPTIFLPRVINDDNITIRTTAFITLSTIVSQFKVKVLPYISKFMPSLLSSFHSIILTGPTPSIISKNIETSSTLASTMKGSLGIGAGLSKIHYLLAVAGLSCIKSLVTEIPEFISSHLKSILLILHNPFLTTSSIVHADNEFEAVYSQLPISLISSAQKNELASITESLNKTVSESVPPRVLLPIIYNAYNEISSVFNTPIETVSAHTSLIKTIQMSLKNMSVSDFPLYYAQLFKFLLAALDTSNTLPLKLALPFDQVYAKYSPGTLVLEKETISAMFSLFYGLSEDTFKPLLLKLQSWQSGDESQAGIQTLNRQRIYYTAIRAITDSFKSVFIPFYPSIIPQLANYITCYLDDTNTESYHKNAFSIVSGQNNMTIERSFKIDTNSLQNVVASINCMFLYDSDGTLSQSQFSILAPPLIALLTSNFGLTDKQMKLDTEEDTYIILVKTSIVPAIAQMAVAVNTLELRKQTNALLLKLTRNKYAKVRFAALLAIEELYKRIGDQMCGLIQESVPYISECLEDSNQLVENMSKDLIRTIETFNGESISKYF